MSRITFTVIKADIGGFIGHSSVHPDLIKHAEAFLDEKGRDVLVDFKVAYVGDDINLIMTHQKGVDCEEIHKLAWDTFLSCTQLAKQYKLYGAGQDLLSDSFSGNIKGMGPGVAEMEFEERASEPVIVFMADKTEPGAWNFPLYKIFADPFNTIGLIIDPKMHDGFVFEILDTVENKKMVFSCPEEIYDLLVFLGASNRYAVKAVYNKKGEQAAASSTQRMNLMAGRYVGKDDPVLIVRCQNGFPAVGEALEPFANPHLVAGWMRGSHFGPLMPVSCEDATPTRFDGPPRVVALGFQVTNGKLIGPQDLFKDKGFDRARQKALEIADYIRSLGPFEPHRLPLDEMEYTTLPLVIEKMKSKLKK
ncbi:MAG: fructose-1,6-bisphosphate aldolase/phosphatase [Thermovenabulum sp.]|uniref:fructose-1,6-bisphosphate aldolase/phosphatase n=1 Tax=Thermovenabulum sp. TaxID=3100335 RepID=UPI003C7DFAEC